MSAGSLVMLLLAQAPADAAWTLELNHAPAAVVRARLEGGRFTWSVEHLFGRKARREVTVAVDAKGRDAKGRVPEGLWLMRQPQPGCVPGFDELSGKEGELCAERAPDGRLQLRSWAGPLDARFRRDGGLERLVTPTGTYVRGDGWQGRDPWAGGVAVEGRGDRLGLEPRLDGARVLAAPPRSVGAPTPASDCLTLALERVAAGGPDTELVLGLAVEGDRAWPHAWVRSRAGGDEDPSVPAGERPQRTWLALPAASAGRVYLGLLARSMKVVREAGPRR